MQQSGGGVSGPRPQCFRSFPSTPIRPCSASARSFLLGPRDGARRVPQQGASARCAAGQAVQSAPSRLNPQTPFNKQHPAGVGAPRLTPPTQQQADANLAVQTLLQAGRQGSAERAKRAPVEQVARQPLQHGGGRLAAAAAVLVLLSHHLSRGKGGQIVGVRRGKASCFVAQPLLPLTITLPATQPAHSPTYATCPALPWPTRAPSTQPPPRRLPTNKKLHPGRRHTCSMEEWIFCSEGGRATLRPPSSEGRAAPAVDIPPRDTPNRLHSSCCRSSAPPTAAAAGKAC